MRVGLRTELHPDVLDMDIWKRLRRTPLTAPRSPLSADEALTLLVAWAGKHYPHIAHLHPEYGPAGATADATGFTHDSVPVPVRLTGPDGDLIRAALTHAWVERPVCVNLTARGVANPRTPL